MSARDLCAAVLASALGAGVAVGTWEIAWAGFAGGLWGWLAVLALMSTLGLALGLLELAVIAGAFGGARLVRAGEWLVEIARSLRWPVAPALERWRAAWVLTAVLVVAFAALGFRMLAPAAIAAARADPWAAPLTAAAPLAMLVALALLAPVVARAIADLLARVAAGVSLRGLLLALAVLGLAAVVLVRQPLFALVRALDIGPFASVAIGLVAHTCLLVALVGTPGGRRRARRLASVSFTGAALVALALSWLATLGPASHADDAIRLYRALAPLSRRVAAPLARLLDTDGDGFASVLGDRDCAPDDRKRHPAAIEIAGNGIDDDCFDGDLPAGAEPLAPPPPTPRPVGLPRRPHIVWIACDTLRPDHLGFYGHHRATSPNLDRFAAGATVFETAYAPSSYTFASMPAVFTGLLPNMLPASLMRKSGKVPTDTPMIAELLAAGGYRTSMVSDEGGALGQIGLVRGFARNKAILDQPERTTDTSLREIDGALAAGDPLFLVAYYYTTHSPYTVTDDAPVFGDSFEERYDHEIARFDRHAGRLLARLDQPDMRENTIVVFMSDHGEAFGEHGTYYHGHNLYDENVRVPLVMRVPGAAPRRAGGGVVSLIDIAPTLLNLAGLPIPPAMRGHDQTGVIMGTKTLPADRAIFMQSHFTGYGTSLGYIAAIATARYKLIEYRDSRTTELFDLAADPRETRDIAGREPGVTLELRRVLRLLRSYSRR